MFRGILARKIAQAAAATYKKFIAKKPPPPKPKPAPKPAPKPITLSVPKGGIQPAGGVRLQGSKPAAKPVPRPFSLQSASGIPPAGTKIIVPSKQQQLEQAAKSKISLPPPSLETVRKRLADAKRLEVANIQSGKRGQLWDKITLGQNRRERAAREQAAKFYNENESRWATGIINRQQHYEKKMGELKDWVMQAQSEGDWNKRLADANAWLEREAKTIDDDIADFTKSQKELAAYAQTPLTGFAARAGGATKRTLGKITGTALNALTWTASQPSRLINTGKNVINPNNLRQYYGGVEKKGLSSGGSFSDRLKTAYNESKNQRIVGFSKADEQRRISGWTKTVPVRDSKGKVTWRQITKRPNWLDTAMGRYGDDIVDVIADPLSWIPAGALGKGAKGSGSFVGKTKAGSKITAGWSKTKSLISGSKLGRAGSWLGAEWKPRGAKARDALRSMQDDLMTTTAEYRSAKNKVWREFKGSNAALNRSRSDFLYGSRAEGERQMMRRALIERQAERLAQDFVKRLDNFSDVEVRAMTKYARNGSWSKGDMIRISRVRRNDLGNFLSDYQVRARALAESEGLTNRAKNYLPEAWGEGYDPTARRTLFGSKYTGQSRGQLQESLTQREFMSNWDKSNSYLKELRAIERSILRNAGKTKRTLSAYEKRQLKLVRARQLKIENLNKSYGSKFDFIKTSMAQTRKKAQPFVRIGRRGVQTNFSKRGLLNTAADTYHAPMKLWKKSVLKYNPAWYVNNMMWNIPASISAGGAGVFKQYGKMAFSPKYRNEARKLMPEGVRSKISQEIGKGGLASKIENWSRESTFMALKKKGYSDKDALRITNRWLFDYTTKNWERPIKGLFPFWQWQKNIIRLSGTMPLTNPRSAKFYSDTYEKFYQRPYEQLPKDVQEYTDPETGQKVRYEPREFYKGKAKIGDKWYGIPFFAVNPETAMNFGVNPYLTAMNDWLTSTDRFGRKNTDRSVASLLAERFPQANLARLIKNARDNTDVTRWFAETGSSKWKQGSDKSKPNYDKSLDKRVARDNAKKSFFGIPRGVEFDKKEFDTKKRLTAFNQEFFAMDWDKLEEEDYNKAQQLKKDLAAKHGFDLQKDIYDNYWSKYDTEVTKTTKKLKRKAFEFTRDFWEGYHKLPKGSLTAPSQRRPYAIAKFEEWRKTRPFLDNPYAKFPKGLNPFALTDQEAKSQARRAAGKRKYALWQKYFKLGSFEQKQEFLRKHPFLLEGKTRKSSPYQYNGKFFKSAESMGRYRAFREGRRGDGFAGTRDNPKTEKQRRFFLWQDYFALKTLDERREFLNKHPELKLFDDPKTPEQWLEARAKIRSLRKERAKNISGFTERQSDIKARIEKSVRTPFGRPKRLRYL